MVVVPFCLKEQVFAKAIAAAAARQRLREGKEFTEFRQFSCKKMVMQEGD